MTNEMVYFSLADATVEQTDAGPKLVGYAAKYGVLSEDLGGYRARINKGAFDETINSGKIILALVDHDFDKPIGTNDPAVRSLKLATDDVGLKVEIQPPNTTLAADTFANVKGKLKRGMSLMFPTASATIKWTMEGGTKVRDIYKIPDLKEVSVVTEPAFSQTEIAATFSLKESKEITHEIKKQIEQPKRKSNMSVSVSWQDIKKLEEQKAVSFGKASAIRARESDGLSDEDTAELDRHASDVDALETKIEDAKSAYFGRSVARKSVVTHEEPQKFSAGSVFKGKDLQRYSLLRAINKRVNGQPLDGIEAEVNEEMIKFTGKAPQGFYFPADMSMGGNERYDVTTTTAAGAVNTSVLTSSFIELLRAKTLIDRLGVTYLTNLVGNVGIPRQTGGSTAYWVTEGNCPPESNLTIGQIAMTPKTVGAYSDISRKMILQTSLSAEAMVRDDLAKALALEIDRAAINGSGVGAEPKGVLNYAGIKEFTGTSNLWADAVDLEGYVEDANALNGSLAYVMRPGTKSIAKTTAKVANTSNFIWEGDSMNGYPAYSSTQVPADVSEYGNKSPIIFGNWANLVIGFWGGLDILVDPYTASCSGTVRIRALQDVDIVLRNEAAFAACYVPGT